MLDILEGDKDFDLRDMVKGRDQNYIRSFFRMGWKAKLAQKVMEENLTYHSRQTLVYKDISEDDVIEWLNDFSYEAILSDFSAPFFLHAEELVVSVRTVDRNEFTSLRLNVFAKNKESSEEIFEEIKEEFPEPLHDSHVKFDWYFVDKGDLSHVSFDDFIDDDFYEEAYPFFDDDSYDGIKDWTDRYLESSSTIAFFFGPPGTGKTRLLRYISREACTKDVDKLNVMYISGPKTISLESVFVKFLKHNYDFLIIEDLDDKIKPRTEGNESMTSLLTSSDGVVSSLNKKILITSNIPSLGQHDIDPALLRSGRCFDFMEFEKLNYEQSKTLLRKIGYTDFSKLSKDQKYPISDLYYLKEHNKLPKRKEEVGGTGFQQSKNGKTGF